MIHEPLSRQEFVEWFLAAALLVVGASLLIRSRVWIQAFSGVASHPLAPLASGLYALLVGIAIILTHNVWVADARVLVTAIGWLAAVSGALFVLVPESYNLLLRRLPMTPRFVAMRGLVRLTLGGVLVGYLLAHG